jgi:uncharacterized protein YecE (DUF72 family)
MEFDRTRLRDRLSTLASRGVYVGSSSWKYPGWLGLVYDDDRYSHRGKFVKSRFERDCLAEYAETFKTACVDAAYYAFPKKEYLEGLVAQVPADFRFGFKVTDIITVKRFPNLPRFGARKGAANQDFLNAIVFGNRFLEPCEAIRSHIGLLIFEFSKFRMADYLDLREFIADLDSFFAKVPKGWPYGIEMRNDTWLGPDYFECLARHQVAHVFNSGTDMPPVSEQLAIPGSRTNLGLVAARFLMKPGTTYQGSVENFEPFDRIKQIENGARTASKSIIDEGVDFPQRYTYVFVNNRLEGCAPLTIEAMVEGRGCTDSSRSRSR